MHSASTRSMNREVWAIDLRRISGIEIPSHIFRDSSSAARLSTCCVPVIKRRMPGAGSYSGTNANGFLWPSQPSSGCRTCSISAGATQVYEGAPGPPLRYLYPQPIAKSAPSQAISSSRTPVECERSHTVSAPAARAAALSSRMSRIRPVR